MVRKKKLTKKQKQQRIQLVFTTLLLGVAFLMGLFFGDDSYNIDYFSRKFENMRTDVASVFSNLGSQTTGKVQDIEGTIHFFDVGQGSSTLMQANDGTNILIDTGRYDDPDKKIIKYLDQYIGTGGTIDLLIFTHNDADHIGNGDLVLDYYKVNEVWMNGVDHTTKIYEDVLDAIEESDTLYHEPKANEEKIVGPFKVEVFSPFKTAETDDQNEESIVTRTTLDGVRTTITGDVSSNVENRLIKQYYDLKTDILLIGHHGSHDSTSNEWLDATNPRVGVIQAGADNTYGHPHEETLERIEQNDIPLYNTINNGTITVKLNGSDKLDIEVEKNE
ncbi:MBL fold metallo-hydrolase [Marinilactibacillus sp. 15R]|uniref:ComEC/Rec2 family competence protein n=1 Tax=Marinilactibacillus sp. 15R TaxID=1911586 RepID=UPI0009097A4B|nr:MBL fold metallo-hydrolase [Marinilactibacillus sp. 15R]API89123.1 MBL fold metallo-hydrolase [Marinilactibacillus sp. 15R]